MAVIFINSSLAGRTSSGLSEAIIKTIVNISGWFGEGSLIIRLREMIQSDWFNIFLRKSAHFIEFGILGLLATISAGIFKVFKDRYIIRAGAAALFCCLYAVTDEFHQLFIPGRVCSAIDVIIDFSGAVVFIGIITIILYRTNKGKINE